MEACVPGKTSKNCRNLEVAKAPAEQLKETLHPRRDDPLLQNEKYQKEFGQDRKKLEESNCWGIPNAQIKATITNCVPVSVEHLSSPRGEAEEPQKITNSMACTQITPIYCTSFQS